MGSKNRRSSFVIRSTHVAPVAWLGAGSFLLAGDWLFIPDQLDARLNRLLAQACLIRGNAALAK